MNEAVKPTCPVPTFPGAALETAASAGRVQRTALALAGIGLPIRGFHDIAARLPSLRDVPVRIVSGEHDRILPDVAETVRRVQADLPQAVTTVLPHGHFVTEEAADTVGTSLGDFFATTTA